MTPLRSRSAILWSASAVCILTLGLAWFLIAPHTPALRAAETRAAPPSTSSRPADPRSLNIISANVRFADPDDGINLWNNRRALLVATLQDHNPDIIGCQEVTPAQATYLLKELKGFSFAKDNHADLLSAPAGLMGVMNMLFYRADRFTLLATADGPLRPEAPQSVATENAYYTLAVLADRNHLFPDLIVIDTHLRHGVANAAASAQKIHTLIAAQRKTYPKAQAIVLGDMNHGRGTPVYDALLGPKDGGDPLIDTFDYTTKPAAERWGTYHAFAGKPLADLPSDLIFISPALNSTPATILRDHTPPPDNRYPTDHFLVLTTLTP